MIDIVRKKDKDEDPKQKALEILNIFQPAYMAWTPTKTFTMLIATPSHIAEHFQAEIEASKAYIPALAGDNPVTVREVIRDDAFFLEFSGIGAADIARTARDTLEKNFAGSANIPNGRARG